MCALLVACFLSFFLALGWWINFGFGTRGKTGAWAPDLVAGEGVKQEATNAAFIPCLGEQLWGPGGEGNFPPKKNTLFPAFSQKSVKLLAVIGPGYSPGGKFQENSPILEQGGTRPLKNLCITPTPTCPLGQ